MHPSHDVLFWSLALVQLLGLATCLVTRLLEATRVAGPFQQLFLGSLAVLCGATIAALYCGSVCWISCGATLCITSVAATIDPRGRIEPSAF
jgi:hypothetical protein